MSTADNDARNALAHVERKSTVVARIEATLPVVGLNLRPDYYFFAFFLFVLRELNFFNRALTHSMIVSSAFPIILEIYNRSLSLKFELTILGFSPVAN